MTRRLTLLALGASSLAVAAVQAADRMVEPAGGDANRPCHRCDRRPADSTLEHGALGPNLEWGGADDAFRVTIDGAPPAGKTSVPADAERATDVALASAKVDVQVTALSAQPMLSVVTALPATGPAEPVTFFPLTNYSAFIDHAELRVFAESQSIEGVPLATMPVIFGKPVLWSPEARDAKLRVVLRAYDAGGRFDETAPEGFVVSSAPVATKRDRRDGPLFENQRTTGNIAVVGSEVTVSGSVAEPTTGVSLMGVSVPVDNAGHFVARQIVPPTTREIAVRVGDTDYRRAITLPKNDNFLVAIADLTAGHRSFGAAKIDLQGVDRQDTRRDFVDGRLAFYWKKQLGTDWKLTAAADTGEQPFTALFDDFLKKDSRAFLRRLDPNLHYPVYGDDSTTIEDAPTYGRFYVRVENPNGQAMWGNFHTQLTGTDLIRYQRSLYGGEFDWHSTGTTPSGERRTQINGFAADPGTIASREEFASTGGSVYYLHNQDIAQGSERLFREVRDRDSGLVLSREELIVSRDYDMNYIQGRVLLRSPLSIVSDDSLFVRNNSLAGNPVWLVSTYEFTPGLTRPSALTYGGRAQQWVGDHLRVGVTGYHQGEDQAKQGLYGADVLARYKPGTWLRGEIAHSSGKGNGASFSSTGGYDFTPVAAGGQAALAYILEGAADLKDLTGGGDGHVTGYFRRREAGFSGPGELTFGEGLDQYGGTADVALGRFARFKAKADLTDGTLTGRKAGEVGLVHDTGRGWYGSVGVRADDQGAGQATAYTPFAAPNVLRGERTDAAVTVGYHHVAAVVAPSQDGTVKAADHPWSLSVFGQKTLARDGGRLANDRYGVAGDFTVNQRLTLGGEVSGGDLGLGANAKANLTTGDRGSLYLAYTLAAENPDAFNTGRLGRLTAGAKHRFGTDTNVFAEQRLETGAGPTGLTQAYGVDFTPAKGWTLGARYETGKLADALGQRIERQVVGGTIGYAETKVRWSSALEYRREKSDTLGDRTTYATRNLVTYQASDALRLYGKANLSISNGGAAIGIANSGGGNGVAGVAGNGSLDANYYEVALAGAYRPVTNDKLNLLAKITYLSDLPSPAQVTAYALPIDYAQRSTIGALDLTYQLTPRLAVGGKVAVRVGELRLSRDASAPWFDSQAVFWAARVDYEVVRRWDMLAEIRQLRVSTAGDSRVGALVGIYRHLGQHVKVGAGYNFTNYSDDLANTGYREHGFFFNVVGKF